MADSDASITPEKKLLKLIEEPNASGAQQPKRPAVDFKVLFSPENINRQLLTFKERLTELFQSKQKSFGLKDFISLGRWATLGLGVILILNLLWEFSIVSAPLEYNIQSAISQKGSLDSSLTSLFSSGISSDVDQRNVFAPIGEKVEVQTESGDIKFKMVEMTKQLRLTGISVYPGDPNRTFCMIEDLQKNMTSFLRVGDSVSGLKVTRISNQGVTLSVEGEEIEIK